MEKGTISYEYHTTMVSQNVDASHYVPVCGLNKKNRTIDRAQHATPTRATKMRHAWKVKRGNVGITTLTRDEALAFVNAELGKHRAQLVTLNDG